VWALRADGLEAVRVTGIDVMTRAFDVGRSRGAKHFFYGSTEPVLEAIVQEVTERYPGVSIAGTLSPPFREPTDNDLDDAVRAITASGANVVWVGLGMPKQERWMGNMRNRLPGVALIGVGAAFDWLAGTVPMAPQWMRDRGLEWLFRLVLEPRRLWKRYIYNNPAFLVLLIGRWLKAGARRVLKPTNSG
jgi:N-acetylglucosaminyldiphosphoundecaprenol N-acetyl-beta-D-mannosaminyltransferase